MPTRRKKSKKRKEPRRNSKQTKQKHLTPGQWFEKLVAVQARLRAPNGCPWDREQTHQSLRTYLIEEAYEVVEALESGNDAKFAEEMGDLLLQIVFHSQIAREEGRFTVAEVIREIHDKMIRRHPHVFGKTHAKDSAEVLRNWEQIKAEERRASNNKGESKSGEGVARETSLLDGVSRGLPATLEGYQLTRKASRIGFDWKEAGGVFEKLLEETEELKRVSREKRWRGWLGRVAGSSKISRVRKWKHFGTPPRKQKGRRRRGNRAEHQGSNEPGNQAEKMRESR